VSEKLPFVTIVMPIRNEAGYIERTIRSILDNDYPDDLLEILVADGMSDDGTAEIVDGLGQKDPRVRLFENKGRIVSTGLNMTLRAAKGDVFIRVDGHCAVTQDFIKKSVACLHAYPEAWVDGRSRLGNYDGWVDTVPYGAHYMWVLEKVGYFDEELVRNQDDEFNMRIIQAGGKIRISSDICSTYYSRSSLKKLWRQYFQYGFWRTRTLQKHGKPAVFRQVIPVIFVITIILLALLGLISPLFWWALAALLVIYSLALISGAVDVGRQAGWKCALAAPLIFKIIHFGYGLGTLWGFVRFVLLRGAGMKKPDRMKLSR